MFYYPDKNLFIKNISSIEEFILNEGRNVSRDNIFVKSKIYNF